jgi:hypothetical protein
VQEIRSRLRKEGFSDVIEHLEGRGIRRQLSALIKAARRTRKAIED